MTKQIEEVDAINIQETLDSVRSYLNLYDLQDSIRKLNRQSRSSPLTIAVEEAYSRITRVIEGDDNVVSE